MSDPYLKLADLIDMRKVMEAGGWTYIGDTDNGTPLFAQSTGRTVMPTSTPQFAEVATCTRCAKRIHRRDEKMSWTTLSGDGYTTYCDVGGIGGHLPSELEPPL